MIKLSEEGMLKAETGWKLLAKCECKGKFSKEILSTIPANTGMVRNQNNLFAAMEKVYPWSG